MADIRAVIPFSFEIWNSQLTDLQASHDHFDTKWCNLSSCSSDMIQHTLVIHRNQRYT
jgi:hypothetical protein